MSSINIITLIAIILFARLGIRLYNLHKKYKAEKENEDDDDDDDKNDETHKSNGTL
jgi:hypothetical protein